MNSSPFTRREDIVSWGRVARGPQRVARPRFADELSTLVATDDGSTRLPFGLRRSYGDSCLNSSGALIDMTGLDRLIEFDVQSGVLRAEAGAPLTSILQLIVPHGWFLPTVPGTRYVTLGGAIGNDVHGKNHHRAGSFGRHVRRLGLLRTDGQRHELSPDDASGLFAATIGGLGLTGIVEWAEVQLVRIASAFLDVETRPFASLDEFWACNDESVASHEHTVAWIDCVSTGARFGRGIYSRGDWRGDGELASHGDASWKTVPVDAPSFALSGFSVRAFNELYYGANRMSAGRSRQHYAPFFFPLDAIGHWNRLYGRRGMYQYQCVLPPNAAREGIATMLDAITRSGQASFLAVLKTFGELASPGLLSFPRPGATLALDFPNRGADTARLLERLDAIVADAAGALYPAKDGRLPAAMFDRSFPAWRDFSRFKDPNMQSDFWNRVSL